MKKMTLPVCWSITRLLQISRYYYCSIKSGTYGTIDLMHSISFKLFKSSEYLKYFLALMGILIKFLVHVRRTRLSPQTWQSIP